MWYSPNSQGRREIERRAVLWNRGVGESGERNLHAGFGGDFRDQFDACGHPGKHQQGSARVGVAGENQNVRCLGSFEAHGCEGLRGLREPSKRRNIKPDSGEDALSTQKSTRNARRCCRPSALRRRTSCSSRFLKISAARAASLARTDVRDGDHSVLPGPGGGKFTRPHFVSRRGSLPARALGGDRRADSARRVPYFLHAVSSGNFARER